MLLPILYTSSVIALAVFLYGVDFIKKIIFPAYDILETYCMSYPRLKRC